MAKKYLIKKSFAYAGENGETVYVRKFERNEDGLYRVDEKGFKKQSVVELAGEALKVGKKCKAIEEIDE